MVIIYFDSLKYPKFLLIFCKFLHKYSDLSIKETQQSKEEPPNQPTAAASTPTTTNSSTITNTTTTTSSDTEQVAASTQQRHTQILQQYSSSTDEGCETDHGEMDDIIHTSSIPPTIQRLNSYASSSSSSGVVTNFHSKSLSQNLSCESSRSNFSTFESLDLNLSDCSDFAASLPSCAVSTTATAITDSIRDHGKSMSMFPHSLLICFCSFCVSISFKSIHAVFIFV